MSALAPTLLGGCLRKARYRTLTKAEAVARRCVAERGVPVRAYRCTFCNRYHLTRQAAEALPPLPPPKVVANPCALCGREIADGPGFGLNGAKYHRNCRKAAMKALPVAERRRVRQAWARADGAAKQTAVAALLRAAIDAQSFSAAVAEASNNPDEWILHRGMAALVRDRLHAARLACEPPGNAETATTANATPGHLFPAENDPKNGEAA